MHVRLAALAATLFVAGCANKARTHEPVAAQAKPSRAAMDNAMLSSLNGTELRVRLNQDLGPAASPDKDTFTARVVSPIVGSNGRVIVPVGSLVWGHVVHVDEASRRVEIAFDRLETRTTVYRLGATVIGANPYAVTVRPEGTPSSATVMLQGNAPSAIGGGPAAPESESEEDAPRGDVIVPFDAEMRLQLTEKLVPTTAG
jgi:hypothetical protein